MRKILYIIIFLLVLGTISGCNKGKDPILIETEIESDTSPDKATINTDEESSSTNQEESEQPTTIYVDVSGAVVNPGVYTLSSQARVYEAIDMAGGFTELAATSYVNQAKPLKDGQQINVPTIEEADHLPLLIEETQQESGLSGTSLVNINEAGVEELTTLSGIGTAKAEAIIAYRQSNGRFQTIEEIKNIEGIKEGVFNKIKDKITIQGE